MEDGRGEGRGGREGRGGEAGPAPSPSAPHPARRPLPGSAAFSAERGPAAPPWDR